MNAPMPAGTSLVKARPILFSAPMVRALLDGRKTQTRRIVKPRQYPSLFEVDSSGQPLWSDEYILDQGNAEWRMRDNPYGAPGDLLWVRETWQEFFADEVPVWRRDAPAGRMGIPAQPDRKSVVAYRADGEISPHPEYGHAVWRPSIHMPRWASRLTLRITDVRLQRLQEISDADVAAEGVEPFGDGCGAVDHAKGRAYTTLRGAFSILWDDINGPGAWARNPLVWALTFEVLPGNIAKWAPA